jgi:hypothetical protein
MTRSESINELATALAAAQAEFHHAKRDSENPHFRSRYADLSAIWDACRPGLSSHGLSVVQSPRLVAAGESTWLVEVETLLIHSSGQYLSDVLAVPVTAGSPQAVGSAVTYCKRYSLASFVGIAPAGDDDDGDRASEYQRPAAPKGKIVSAPKAPDPPAGPHGSRVKVLGVVQRAMTDGRVKFIVSGDDLKPYHSFNLQHATVAKEAQSAGLPVAIAYLTVPDGRLIQSIEEVEAPV